VTISWVIIFWVTVSWVTESCETVSWVTVSWVTVSWVTVSCGRVSWGAISWGVDSRWVVGAGIFDEKETSIGVTERSAREEVLEGWKGDARLDIGDYARR
jgi:hypothetical protein